MSELRSSGLDKNRIFYILSAIFIAIAFSGIFFKFYATLLLPIALMVGLMIIYRPETLILSIIFFTPLSVNLEDLDLGFGVSIPGEPLMFGLMLLYWLSVLINGNIDKKIISYPTTKLIFLYLIWMLVTTVTSTMPMVSLKFTAAKIWFITVFYFMLLEMFRNKQIIKTMIWSYTGGLVLVILYTTINHISWGLTERAAHWVMQPFYNDHTAYAAAIAMFVPIMLGFTFSRTESLRTRTIAFVCFLVLMTAIVLSFTRAAWLSLAIALAIYFIYKFRIRFSLIAVASVILLGSFFVLKDTVLMNLEKNRQDSSSDYASHVQSMANIKTDASNLERINRWNSAIRMFMVKPFFGWGPGTYQFQYAPFQRSYELTIISTNAADGGNAHSEYLGPLAESGILGTISVLLIMIVVIYRATLLYSKTEDKDTRTIILGLIIGLMTYYIHGFLNNFLDTDKAAVPFWGFVAALAAIDLFHTPEKKEIS